MTGKTLNDKLARLYGQVGQGDWPPTAQALQLRAVLGTAIEAELARLAELLGADLEALNSAVAQLTIPAIAVD